MPSLTQTTTASPQVIIPPGTYRVAATIAAHEFDALVTSTETRGVPTTYRVRVRGADDERVRRPGMIDAYEACVDIVLDAPNHPDDRVRELLRPRIHIARIVKINFHPRCSITRELQRGGGTEVMVKSALTFVTRTFPWITDFTLTDASTVDCGDECGGASSYPVSLTALSLCTTGQTWYERAFGARLEDGMAAYRLAVASSALMDPAKKPATADDFCRAYGVPETVAWLEDAAVQVALTGNASSRVLQASQQSQQSQQSQPSQPSQPSWHTRSGVRLHSLIQTLYDECRTVSEVFVALRARTRHDRRAPFCHLVAGWVDRLLGEVLPREWPTLRQDKWVITPARAGTWSNVRVDRVDRVDRLDDGAITARGGGGRRRRRVVGPIRKRTVGDAVSPHRLGGASGY